MVLENLPEQLHKLKKIINENNVFDAIISNNDLPMCIKKLWEKSLKKKNKTVEFTNNNIIVRSDKNELYCSSTIELLIGTFCYNYIKLVEKYFLIF